jgi:hypothetical protein
LISNLLEINNQSSQEQEETELKVTNATPAFNDEGKDVAAEEPPSVQI